MIEILKPDFFYKDERGTIIQLIHEGYQQINVINTFSGYHRGRMHYHEYNNELFYIISGVIELKCIDIRTQKTNNFIFKQGDMFKVLKYIGHDFYFIEDTLIISMYDNGVEFLKGVKDIVEVI